MRHFTFGRNNGLRVSALALGAGTFGTRWGYGAAPEDVPRDVRHVRRRGRHVHRHRRELSGRRGRGDSRPPARRQARRLHRGDEVRHRRHPTARGVLQTGNGRRAMSRSVEGSLRRLGHRLHRSAVGALSRFRHPARRDRARARRSRKVGQDPLRRAVELSGVDDGTRSDYLAELRGAIPISGVQLEYSLVERSADRENLPMAESLGLGAALWSPLGGGLLTRQVPIERRTAGSPIGIGSCTPKTSLPRRRRSTRSSTVADETRRSRGAGRGGVAVWNAPGDRRRALVPVIGPRTVEQVDSYVASLDLVIGSTEEQYLTRSTRSVGIPDGRAVRDQLAAAGHRRPLGGDGFSRLPIPSAECSQRGSQSRSREPIASNATRSPR